MIILLSTRNFHKVEELKTMAPTSFELHALSLFPDFPEIEETADTFAGNALLKANHLVRWLQETGAWRHVMEDRAEGWVLADDSGLEVDALQGAPGVYSARFAFLEPAWPVEKGMSVDDANNAKLMHLLAGREAKERRARFRCVLAWAPLTGEGRDEQARLFEGVCEGSIAINPAGEEGFGYDPLFVPEGFGESLAQLGAAQKHRLSHRGKAMQAWRDFLLSSPDYLAP